MGSHLLRTERRFRCFTSLQDKARHHFRFCGFAFLRSLSAVHKPYHSPQFPRCDMAFHSRNDTLHGPQKGVQAQIHSDDTLVRQLYAGGTHPHLLRSDGVHGHDGLRDTHRFQRQKAEKSHRCIRFVSCFNSADNVRYRRILRSGRLH